MSAACLPKPWPPFVVTHLLEYLVADSENVKRDLASCSLVNSWWREPSQKLLLHSVHVDAMDNGQRIIDFKNTILAFPRVIPYIKHLAISGGLSVPLTDPDRLSELPVAFTMTLHTIFGELHQLVSASLEDLFISDFNLNLILEEEASTARLASLRIARCFFPHSYCARLLPDLVGAFREVDCLYVESIHGLTQRAGAAGGEEVEPAHILEQAWVPDWVRINRVCLSKSRWDDPPARIDVEPLTLAYLLMRRTLDNSAHAPSPDLPATAVDGSDDRTGSAAFRLVATDWVDILRATEFFELVGPNLYAASLDFSPALAFVDEEFDDDDEDDRDEREVDFDDMCRALATCTGLRHLRVSIRVEAQRGRDRDRRELCAWKASVKLLVDVLPALVGLQELAVHLVMPDGPRGLWDEGTREDWEALDRAIAEHRTLQGAVFKVDYRPEADVDLGALTLATRAPEAFPKDVEKRLPRTSELFNDIS